MKALEEDPLSALSKAEVTAGGKTFTVERKYRRGTAGTEACLTDDEITEKFRHNAERVLTKKQIENAVSALTDIENLDNISQLMDYVTT